MRDMYSSWSPWTLAGLTLCRPDVFKVFRGSWPYWPHRCLIIFQRSCMKLSFAINATFTAKIFKYLNRMVAEYMRQKVWLDVTKMTRRHSAREQCSYYLQCRAVSAGWRSEHVKRCSAPWTEHREREKCRIFIWPSTVANCCWPRWLMDQMYTSAPGSKESSFRTLVIKCFENHYSFWHYYIIQRFNDGLFNDRTQGQMQLLLGNITLPEIFTSRKCPPHLRRQRLLRMTYCPHHLSGTLENIENRFNPELLKMSSKSR